MNEGARKTGTDDREVLEAEVVGQTGFERALDKRVSKRNPAVRGPQIKVLSTANDTSAASQTPEAEAEMNRRVGALHAELETLDPKKRKARMSEVEQAEPDLFAVVKQTRAANKQRTAEAMRGLNEVRTAGAEAQTMIQGALADVSAKVGEDLHTALGKEEFTPIPSSGVRGTTDADTDAKKAG